MCVGVWRGQGSVNRYQHLIDACGSDAEKLAELAVVLTAHIILLAGTIDTAEEKQRALPYFLDARAALDELQRRVPRPTTQ